MAESAERDLLNIVPVPSYYISPMWRHVMDLVNMALERYDTGYDENDVLRALLVYGAFQCGSGALAIGRFVFAFLLMAVGVTGLDPRPLAQQLQIGTTALDVAGHGQGAEGVPVVALPAGDEVAPLRFADFDKILAGHLEGGLDRFRTAGN